MALGENAVSGQAPGLAIGDSIKPFVIQAAASKNRGKTCPVASPNKKKVS